MRIFPDLALLGEQEKRTPDYMRPNSIPLAVAYEGWFDRTWCEKTAEVEMVIEPYKYPHCNAITREMARPFDAQMSDIRELIAFANETFWNYDLDEGGAAWLQTYSLRGDHYPLHADQAPGQMRKLTAVVMLTDEKTYSGGDLIVYSHPLKFGVPRQQGTVVVFQAHLLHEVSETIWGTRQTINMGIYGPPFR